MKQEISALMDGELSEEDANAIFDKLKRNPDAHEEWATYHLISEVLRQPDRVQTNIHMAIRDRLQDEPTVLAPPTRPRQDSRWFTLLQRHLSWRSRLQPGCWYRTDQNLPDDNRNNSPLLRIQRTVWMII